MSELLRDEICAVLSYDEETGDFRWKKRMSSRAGAGDIAGQITCYGYRQIQIAGHRYFAHRLAWFLMTGSWPTADVDHINMVRSDNRWSNLRHATRSQNKANTRAPSTNTSGLKGVSWHKARGNWRATIKVGGKSKHLGSFASEQAAHAAYQAALALSFGEFARAE